MEYQTLSRCQTCPVPPACQEHFCIHTTKYMPLDAIPSPSPHTTPPSQHGLNPKLCQGKGQQQNNTASSSGLLLGPSKACASKKGVLFRKSHLPFRLSPFEVKTCSFFQAMSIHFPVTTIC